MKIKKIIISSLMAITILATCFIVTGIDSHPAKAAEHANSIESCLTRVNELKFNSSEEVTYSDSLITKNDEIYSFDSDIACYKVKQSTGEIQCIYRKDILNCDELKISQDKALEIAKSIVQEYRSDFDLSSMTLTKAKQHESKSIARYAFEWRLFKEGIDIGHTMYVEINGNGEFLCFMCNNNIDYEPDLSKIKYSEQEVIVIAKESISETLENEKLNNLKIDSSQLSLYNGEVVWEVSLSTFEVIKGDTEGNTMEFYYLLVIDAETGKIIDKMVG